jgi:hypothetical protein
VLTPELEVLDQLLGGDLPLHVVAALFDDSERCDRAIAAMIAAGEVRVLDSARAPVPLWRVRELRSQPEFWAAASGYRLEITDAGSKRIA